MRRSDDRRPRGGWFWGPLGGLLVAGMVARGEPPQPPPHSATLENAAASAALLRQQLDAEVRQRLQGARALVDGGQPEAALSALKLAQNLVRSAAEVDEVTRSALDRALQASILETVRAQERIDQERAEDLRRTAAAEQQIRALDRSERGQETVNTLMTQWLMGPNQ